MTDFGDARAEQEREAWAAAHPEEARRQKNSFWTKFTLISMSVLTAAGLLAHRSDVNARASLDESNIPVVAKVISDTYRMVPRVEKSGFLYLDTLTNIVSNYNILAVTPAKDTISVNVFDGGSVAKESLDALISKGSVISFPKGNVSSSLYKTITGETYFIPGTTKAGSKRADRITVL